jgi:hypothetical protein
VLEHIDTIDLRRTVAIAARTAAHFPGTPLAATLQLPAAEALVVQLAGPSLTVRCTARRGHRIDGTAAGAWKAKRA